MIMKHIKGLNEKINTKLKKNVKKKAKIAFKI